MPPRPSPCRGWAGSSSPSHQRGIRLARAVAALGVFPGHDAETVVSALATVWPDRHQQVWPLHTVARDCSQDPVSDITLSPPN